MNNAAVTEVSQILIIQSRIQDMGPDEQVSYLIQVILAMAKLSETGTIKNDPAERKAESLGCR